MSSGKITAETLDPKVARNYIGARGFGIYFLRKEVEPGCDPLSPGNKLIMATGPLIGTAAPTGARYVVTIKSVYDYPQEGRGSPFYCQITRGG